MADITQTPDEVTKKVLLVEDDQGLASVYVTRLEAEGFQVKHVPNGEDALSTSIEFKPDLILLDVMMPKISGFDVLDILKNTPETQDIRIIMLTALSQDSDIEKAKSLGVDDYLVKSQVVIADVVKRIKEHLDMAEPESSPETADEASEQQQAAVEEAPSAEAEANEISDSDTTEENTASNNPFI